jgi:hypothetical protein
MRKAKIGDVVRIWPNAHPEHGGGPLGSPEIEGVVVLRAGEPNNFFVVANEEGHWRPLNDEDYSSEYTQCIGHDEGRAKAIMDLATIYRALRHLL